MSVDLAIVIEKIAGLLGVILVGAFLARAKLIPQSSLALLNQVTVDVFLPAMIFTRLLASTDATALVEQWHLPLVATAMFAASLAFSWLVTKPLPNKRHALTFLASTANWIYLPYPIMKELFGRLGEQIILLLNVGALCTIWTLGLSVLNAQDGWRTGVKKVIYAPGVWATFLALGLIAMGVNGQETAITRLPIAILDYLGQLTIPLSLVMMGANLYFHFDRKNLTASMPVQSAVLRLVVLPWVIFAGLVTAKYCGLSLSDAQQFAVLLIACMPTAINAGMLVERYTAHKKDGYDAVLLSCMFVPATLWINMSLFQWLLG